MTEVGSRGDHNKRQRPRRKKKPKRGAYTPDELIKLWGVGQSQKCPNLDAIVLRTHEVHEKGDLAKVKVIFPIQKGPELPPEIVAIKTRNFKKVHGRPRDFYTRDGIDYKV